MAPGCVARDLVRGDAGSRSGTAQIQRAGLVRRPHPDARPLPLSALLHGRPGRRGGVAPRRCRLHADPLGRTDRPEPHAGRRGALHGRGSCRTDRRPAPERPLRHTRRTASGPALRHPPRRHIPAPLQADARSAGRPPPHRHRPVPRGRRRLRHAPAERPPPPSGRSAGATDSDTTTRSQRGAPRCACGPNTAPTACAPTST